MLFVLNLFLFYSFVHMDALLSILAFRFFDNLEFALSTYYEKFSIAFHEFF